jgi:CubicO group peptidase (beta-lactamase class C family)
MKDLPEILKDYQGLNPGCALAFVEHGKLAYQYFTGYADLEHKVFVTPQTNFRLASVTKQFTASAIMLLVDQGKISLEDTLTKFFPVIPHYAHSITIFELLSHQSGILDYEELLKHIRGQVTDEEVLELEMNQTHGYFDPGKGYRYSNGAYCILELIVEKISGMTFADFMKENFFVPLGMVNTVIDIEGVTQVPNRAYGYSRNGDSWRKTDEDMTSATVGDGGAYSSIKEMILWNNSFDNATILSRESIAKIFTRYVLTDEDGGETYYGFGYFLKNHNGDAVQYHGGASIGFRTGIYRIPEREISVIFLSNRNEGEGSVICEAIYDQY